MLAVVIAGVHLHHGVVIASRRTRVQHVAAAHENWHRWRIAVASQESRITLNTVASRCVEEQSSAGLDEHGTRRLTGGQSEGYATVKVVPPDLAPSCATVETGVQEQRTLCVVAFVTRVVVGPTQRVDHTRKREDRACINAARPPGCSVPNAPPVRAGVESVRVRIDDLRLGRVRGYER